MPIGTCDACGAATSTLAAIGTEEMKAAVGNGFQPRYGLADFEAGFMTALGADFGVSGLQPSPELQSTKHRKAIADFLTSLQTKESNSRIELCSVCSVLAKQRVARPVEDAPPEKGSLACSLCGASITSLPGNTDSYHILDWLQELSGKGFRCSSCSRLFCTSCMVNWSPNEVSGTAMIVFGRLVERAKAECGTGVATVCALSVRLALNEATCPTCQRKSIGYSKEQAQ